MDRAREKLGRTRQGHPEDKKVSICIKSVSGVGIFIAIISLLLVFAAYQVSSQSPTIAFVLLSVALLYLVALAYVTMRTVPKTPKRTIYQFYRALGHGNIKRGKGLVCADDLDNTGRTIPYVENLGQSTGIAYIFNDRIQFKHYWKQLLRDSPLPYCRAKVTNAHFTEIADDVVIADFHLKLTRNTHLWQFLLIAGLLPAIIADIATRRVTRVQMRKVLIKVNDEWKVFSGEWQGL